MVRPTFIDEISHGFRPVFVGTSTLARTDVCPKTYLNVFPLTLKHKTSSGRKQNDVIFRASVQIPFLFAYNVVELYWTSWYFGISLCYFFFVRILLWC